MKLFFLSIVFLSLISCSKDKVQKIDDSSQTNSSTNNSNTNNSENENSSETKISEYNSMESHNIGLNCMTCHSLNGSGEGWFKAAGSVFDSLRLNKNANTTVKLYTGPQGTGTLKYTIQTDGKGNFYTTQTIDFGSGLYPAIQGKTQTKYMSSPISTGQCNSCHGISTDKIWTK